MTFDSELIDEIIAVITPLPEQFGINDSSGEIEFQTINWIEEQLSKIDPRIIIRYGVSKMVIYSPKMQNVVIKIPFNGYYIEAEDEDGGTFDDWYYFDQAAGSDCEDYCLSEFEKYNQLKEKELNCFVAETIFYKKVYNTRFFIQEYVESLASTENWRPASLKSQEIAKAWQKKTMRMGNLRWIANCIDAYGEDKTRQFLYYCNKIDLDILQDFHFGNYGYREDGTPCILDYSGFFD